MTRNPFESSRICALATLFVALLLSESSTAAELTKREAHAFGQICAYCHARPETSAPVMGDETQWQQRGAKGFEALVQNTIMGVGNMPALGTCGYCTESEIRKLVEVISGINDPAAQVGE